MFCLDGVQWRKSSHSMNATNCVEVAALPRTVAVRDSKDPHQTPLAVAPRAWTAFTTAARTGRLR